MILRIRVNSARHLPKMDFISDTDAYCKLRIIGFTHEESTKVISDTNSPVWNESFQFNIQSYDSDILRLQMFDQDLIRDDAMGILNIEINKLPPGQVIDSWYTLEPVPGCEKPGEINLTLQLSLSNTPPWISAHFNSQTVVVKISEGRNIAANSNAYVVGKVKGSRTQNQTKVKENTNQPIWNETMRFLIISPTIDSLEFVVWNKSESQDEVIGKMDLRLEPFVDFKLNDAWYSLESQMGKSVGDLHLQVQIVEILKEQSGVSEPGRITSDKIPKV
jgi:Ca2+-dependent lipid-binding protein